MKKGVLTFLVLCFLFQFSALAKNGGKIVGKITSNDGEPVAFATVMLMSAADSSMVKANVSDVNGLYEIIGASSGQYFIEVTYVGFGKYSSDIFAFDANTAYNHPNIVLEVASEELEEVVVKSTRPIVEVHPDKTVFNVDGSINATGNTALELLRKSPGVVVDNNDNIILAGKSGVQIYIDNKPSPLSSDDLANFLKTMQSSEIDNIEIITNPSAKYDAEGNAGIINIILKKDKSLGTNASVNLGFRYGVLPKYNASTTYNYRNKAMNVFGNYGYFNGENENKFNLYREQQGYSYDQRNVMREDNESHNFKLGTDFFINEKSTVGFMVHGNINDNANEGRSITDIAPQSTGQISSILDATNDREGERNNLNFNLNYAWRENGKTWNVDVDYGRFRNDASSFQPNKYFDPTYTTVESELTFSLVTPTDIDIYTAKFDRETDWLGGKFGFGAKFSLVETDNTFNFFDIIDDQRVLNEDRSNNFIFEENINAAYLSYQRQIKEKWNLMLGLRMENTHSTGTLTTFNNSDDEVDLDYTDWFPSAGLTYQVNQKNSLRLNYSRRIDRPSYQDLNPFEFKLDELTFAKGNAFLRPQYSNAISLTHTFNYRLNTSLSYTRINNVFTRITKADPVREGSSLLVFENLAQQTNIALTVSYPFSVAKWWNVYANLTGYNLHNEAVIDGDEIDLDVNVLSFYAQNTFSLPKGFKLELSGWYNSPALWEGNWTTESMYSVDIGLQKKLLNDRANLKISFSDIFYSQRWAGESTFGELYITGNGQWESQQIRINFSYLLGNTQVKSSRRRSTGLEDEQKRIKTDN